MGPEWWNYVVTAAQHLVSLVEGRGSVSPLCPRDCDIDSHSPCWRGGVCVCVCVCVVVCVFTNNCLVMCVESPQLCSGYDYCVIALQPEINQEQGMLWVTDIPACKI